MAIYGMELPIYQYDYEHFPSRQISDLKRLSFAEVHLFYV